MNGGTVTDRSSLTQNLGTINVNAAYDFSNYIKTSGVLNNNSILTLTGASISGGTFNNAGALNLNGNAAISDTINGGTVNVNADFGGKHALKFQSVRPIRSASHLSIFMSCGSAD